MYAVLEAFFSGSCYSTRHQRQFGIVPWLEKCHHKGTTHLTCKRCMKKRFNENNVDSFLDLPKVSSCAAGLTCMGTAEACPMHVLADLRWAEASRRQNMWHQWDNGVLHSWAGPILTHLKSCQVLTAHNCSGVTSTPYFNSPSWSWAMTNLDATTSSLDRSGIPLRCGEFSSTPFCLLPTCSTGISL